MVHPLYITQQSIMGVKLIILAAVAVGALFTLHLLAQDFVKIRKTFLMMAAKAAKSFIGKRDVLNPISDVESESLNHQVKYVCNTS